MKQLSQEEQETEDLKNEVDASIIERCANAIDLGIQPSPELIDPFLSAAKEKGCTESELSELKKTIEALPMKTEIVGTA